MDVELLVKTAARLYSVGVELEAAKERLRHFVEEGVSFSSPEMLSAAEDYQALKEAWCNLEQQYLSLRATVQTAS